MRTFLALATTAILLGGPLTPPAIAQSTDGDSRGAIVEQSQAKKSTALRPYVPSSFERLVTRVENTSQFVRR